MCEGDKKAEEEVDECLLIPFRHCLRWNIDQQSSSSEKHDRHYVTVTADGQQVSITWWQWLNLLPVISSAICLTLFYSAPGMLTRPDILRPRPRPRPEVRGRGQDQRAGGRDRGQRFEAKAENEAQIVCKNRIVIPKHSCTMRWIKSESDRAFHWMKLGLGWPRLSEFPVATAI